MFYTIQGEGPFVGRPALFVRLNGCNLKCHWCDTEYTEKRSEYTKQQLIDRIQASLKMLPLETIVVITGGEPMAQPITKLVKQLSQSPDTIVQIETNGTAWPPMFHTAITRDNVHVVVSPKAGKLHEGFHSYSHFVSGFKYIVRWDDLTEDGLPNQSTQIKKRNVPVARPPHGVDRSLVFISPLDDEDREANMKHAVQVVMRHGYTMSLQTHKILNVE